MSVTDERLALALDAAQMGTWTWDMASGVTVWDARLEEMHGLPPGGFGGTYEDWLAALHPDDRDECLARVERALQSPGPYVLLHRTIWPGGSIHWVECRGVVQIDEEGVPVGTTGVALDVTAREYHGDALVRALENERETVGRLQDVLLPVSLPTVPGVAVACRHVASGRTVDIGGDWYAVVPLGGRVGLAIGDIAGHGLEAVADMAAARFSLRALALSDPTPDVVLSRLSEVLRVFERDSMSTALYGVLDPDARVWTYASAGHYPAVVRSVDGEAVLLDTQSDMPLGVGREFCCHDAGLTPGATLVLYTDGLIERRRRSVTDGLELLLAACRQGPAEPSALCSYLIDVLLGDGENEDDVAILVANLTETPAAGRG